ncbi:MAG TPA: AAA family ATPase [bacterium]|nr:AAA family ATPase [bacterium]HQG44630.1 AAA family ATPase [bacterium]HQI49076.1 AAA family ATPase [bacterium]HQJ63277.1 AAA family ATPase [bacterium]
MIISKIEIRAFKSIYELALPLDPHINVLIGANESGKSNILKALEAFREKVALDASFTCQYSNHYYMAKPPELTLEFSGFTNENRRLLQAVSESFKEVERFKIRKEGPTLNDYHLLINVNPVESIDMARLLRILPKILYFPDIRLLKNRVDYDDLIANLPECATERNLLKIGGVDRYETIFEDNARGRRALEEAGRIITEQLRRVWSQEPTIEVKLNVNGRALYIDFSDSTTVFDTPESRSLGFRWYLSFYVNFLAQTFEAQANEYLFLFDEPGIHLHPSGQKDLMKVLEDLALKNQVIFSTHSPFMINRQFPERVILVVKDKNGTRIDNQAYREHWKPLRDEIGLKVGDLFFFSDSSIIVELPTRKSGILEKFKAKSE